MSDRPNPTQAAFEEANAYSREKRWADAIASYRKVLAASPRHEWALNNIGFCLTQAGEHAEAVSRLRQAVEVNPDNAMAHANLVAAMEEADLWVEAIPYRRRLTELRPDSA